MKSLILYAQENPEEQARLFFAFEPVFSEKYQLNYNENFSGIDSKEESLIYFKKIAKASNAEWMKLRTEANCVPSLDEIQDIEKKLEQQVVNAVNICQPFIATQKSGADLGLRVQSELQAELETELQIKLQNQNQLEGKAKELKEYIADDFILSKFPLTSTDYEKSLVPADSTLLLPGEFDSNIFISKQQAWTLANGKEDDTPFDEYHNKYTKPIHAVMMIASKKNPKDSLQCVILTRNEMEYYTKKGKKGLEQAYPDQYLWFVSPSEAFTYEIPLFGTPPKEPPNNYYRVLEQVRFINGDIKDLANEPSGFSWIRDNSEKKLNFLVNKVLPFFSAKEKFVKLFKSKLEQIGIALPDRIVSLITPLSVLKRSLSSYLVNPNDPASPVKTKDESKTKAISSSLLLRFLTRPLVRGIALLLVVLGVVGLILGGLAVGGIAVGLSMMAAGATMGSGAAATLVGGSILGASFFTPSANKALEANKESEPSPNNKKMHPNSNF